MTLKQVIEALVFASPKPISTRELAAALKAAGEDTEDQIQRDYAKAREPEVTAALSELAEEYRQSGRAFQLVEQVNGWALVSDSAAAAWVRQLYPEAKPTRLTGPQLETLAIVAYRQPVTRADIEAVRGVAVDGVMQVLLDRGLVKIAGRAEVPGRPLLYQTTEYFLQHFGLKNVDDLPNSRELKRVALPAAKIPTEPPAPTPEPAPRTGFLADPHSRARHQRMSLPDIRKKIDAIDQQLVQLFNERADLVHEIGVVKRAEGSAIYAPEREEQVLQRLVEMNTARGGRLPEKAVRAIYREIMSASLALEKDLTIAYLGPEATYTHQAARSKFGASVNYSPQVNIADVFDRVARGHADYGVVPIENSTEGAVNHTLDVFTDSELRICAQILLKIENNLMARIPREQIRKIYSHPQVFGQCRNWLRSNLREVEMIEVSSTTRAAEMAAAEPDAAALAGRMAAEVYGLNILEAAIQDSPNNTTRFLVIGHFPSPATGHDRTSLMFCVQDKPGALFAALEPFNRLRISMSKIESRPSKRKAWEYFFFADVDGHATEPQLQQALAELEKHCSFVKILGTYPKTPAA